MANKLRISYRLEPETKRMITAMAKEHNVSETMIIEVAVRNIYENRAPLDKAFRRTTIHQETTPHA